MLLVMTRPRRAAVGFSVTLLLAVLLGLWPRVRLPPHMRGHPVAYKEDLIPPALAKEMLGMVKGMRRWATELDGELDSPLPLPSPHPPCPFLS